MLTVIHCYPKNLVYKNYLFLSLQKAKHSYCLFINKKNNLIVVLFFTFLTETSSFLPILKLFSGLIACFSVVNATRVSGFSVNKNVMNTACKQTDGMLR